MIRQSLSSLVQTAAGSVTVEPVLVLFSLSQGIYMITSQMVYIDKGGLFSFLKGCVSIATFTDFVHNPGILISYFIPGLPCQPWPGR